MKRPLWLSSSALGLPVGMIVFFVGAYGMVDIGLWLIEHGAGNLAGDVSSVPEIKNIRTGILGFAAALCALYRVVLFHPACNAGYAAWLKSSPWTPGRPLPLGPVHPVWQDAVVIGVLAALAKWHAHIGWILPIEVFGLAYLIVMSLLLVLTRTWIPSLLLGFLWPLLMLAAMKGWPTTGIFAALIIVVWFGHRKSLRAFPWAQSQIIPTISANYARTDPRFEGEIRVYGLTPSPAAQGAIVGWPLQWLSPKPGGRSISLPTSVALSALFGWWAYCDIVALDLPACPELPLLFAIVGGLIRWVIYCMGLGPPFNVWGRLASGRLIVPGFDQVFVTPLIAIAVAVAGGVIIRHAGTWYPAATGIVFAAIWFVLMSGRPRMRKWLLTGDHRSRPPSKFGSNQRLLRPI